MATKRRCPALYWPEKGEPPRCELPVHGKLGPHRSGDLEWSFPPGRFMGLGWGAPGWGEKVEVSDGE